MGTYIFYGISILVLICLSAFFSSAETAFSSVGVARLRSYVDKGDTRAKTALYILENYDKALTTILIGNNIVNIGCSSLGTLLCMKLFGDYGAAISTGLVTLLVLTFGEITPKSFAKRKSENICRFSAPVLKILMLVFTPFSFFFMKLNNTFTSSKGDDTPSVTENELKYIIESIEEEGVLEMQESELVNAALDFDEKTAQEILTPRVDLCAIDIDDTPENIRKTILEERFSRLPVYRDSVDNIIGILHARDYLDILLKGETPNLEKLIQPAYFVFKTKKLSNLLAEFKHNRLHIAIVADEYGGTIGIVTMEDLLEELVGDIWDEDEEAESLYTRVGDNEYTLNADMNLHDFAMLMDLDEKKLDTDSNTLGGFIMEMLGNIPSQGESVSFRNITFTIDKVEDKRIKSVSALREVEDDD